MSATTAASDATPEYGSKTFLKYYTENDFFLSPEGILKILAFISCLVSAALYLWGGGGRCAGVSGALAAGAATSALASAACALLSAGVVLHAPLLAPQAWLYTDIIVSTVLGVLLLVTGLLSVTVCSISSVFDYMHMPLALVTAGTLTASAVMTYAAAMRAGATLPRRLRPPAPTDQEV